MCRPVEEKRKPRRDAPSANRKLPSYMAAKPTPWCATRHRPRRRRQSHPALRLPCFRLLRLLFFFRPLLNRRRRRPNRQPNISQDFREDAVDAPWHGWSAPRRGTRWRGCTRASMTFSTRLTATSTDRSALQVRLRALFVPSDRNRPPRGASAGLLPWQERLGRGGGGARAVG